MTKRLRRVALSGALALMSALLLGAPALSATAAGSHPIPAAVVPAAEAQAGAQTQPKALAQWSWPVKPPYALVRTFIAPETPYSAGHRGIDIELALGENVYAPADGVVHFSGVVATRHVLSLAHDGELISSYEAVRSTLAKGDTVAEGEVVGVLAEGGHCSSRCLHFSVRLRGDYVSPLLLLGGVPRAVLLPLG